MRQYILVVLAGFGSVAVAQHQTAGPTFRHPLFQNQGGIVPLSDAAQQPQKNSKVVLDITSATMKGGVIKGFDRAALISNKYAQVGAGPNKQHGLQMAIILHGEATKAALTDEAFVKHATPYEKELGAKGNLNLELIRELREGGVEVFVCGQALAHHGFGTSEVDPSVTVAVSAATLNINKQMDGYAYLPFH